VGSQFLLKLNQIKNNNYENKLFYRRKIVDILFYLHNGMGYSNSLKPKTMNQVNEKISIKEASCREIYLPDLMNLLQSDKMKFWSWGSHGYTVDKKKNPQMFRFTVSGHHHKGHVYIFLNGMDLFDVYLTSNRGTIKQRTDEMGLFVDELMDWIDEKVERIPEYKD